MDALKPTTEKEKAMYHGYSYWMYIFGIIFVVVLFVAILLLIPLTGGLSLCCIPFLIILFLIYFAGGTYQGIKAVQHSQKAKEEYYIEKAKQVYNTENEKIAGKDYKYCSNCGAEVTKGGVFCSNCGVKLST